MIPALDSHIWLMLRPLFAVPMLIACAPSAAADVRALPVPNVTIHVNDVITAALVIERNFRVTTTSIAGFATDRGAIIGKQARRTLVAGKPIPLLALGAAIAIRRGATISAVYNDEGFSITASLIALQDGSAGDTIEARNNASGIQVNATVQSDGTVLVSSE